MYREDRAILLTIEFPPMFPSPGQINSSDPFPSSFLVVRTRTSYFFSRDTYFLNLLGSIRWSYWWTWIWRTLKRGSSRGSDHFTAELKEKRYCFSSPARSSIGYLKLIIPGTTKNNVAIVSEGCLSVSITCVS